MDAEFRYENLSEITCSDNGVADSSGVVGYDMVAY
jgi:hypothetical protein